MKQFKKPEFKINKINDYSEPVFMSCSGTSEFDFSSAEGYTHQVPQTGRMDFREHISGTYNGTHQLDNIDVYAYVTFDYPVANVEWDDYFKVISISDDGLTVIGKKHFGQTEANPGHTFGLGALFVTPAGDQNQWPTNLTITSVKLAYTFDGTICK